MLGGPISDEISKVLSPNWRNLGLEIDYTEVIPGFFPSGGGEAELSIEHGQPASLQALEHFMPLKIGIEVLSSGLPVHLAEQVEQAAQDRLAFYGLKGVANIRRAHGGKGMALLAWARGAAVTVGFSAIGRRGGRPGELATAAVDSLAGFMASGAGVPARLAASLLPLLIMARGVSRITVDRLGADLGGVISAVDAFYPGCVRVDLGGPREPAEIRIMGLGLAA